MLLSRNRWQGGLGAPPALFAEMNASVMAERQLGTSPGLGWELDLLGSPAPLRGGHP
jgi:hypothetical protein